MVKQFTTKSTVKSVCLVCLVLIGAVVGFGTDTSKAAEPRYELPKTGINLARDDGGWINVLVGHNRFEVSFFNDQKAPVAADVNHGLVRYSYAAKARDRTVLTNSGDGMALVSPGNVRPPWVFRVHLALFNEGPEDLTETYAFSYSQD